jgi:4-amino-4-deoxy-L-arabinose transferase-like glycosyltransferase
MASSRVSFDRNYLWIALLSLILFLPFLGKVHLFDWDEINFAESAREMILTGDYLTVQVNFVPFWEKPPLFIWMQVLSMKIFGINEFAARFPNAIAGLATLLFLYFAGKKLYNKRFGLFWAMAYGGSVLPFFYFKSGIIDPWFNLFIFSGVYSFYEYSLAKTNQQKVLFAILSGTLIGLGILTKGPVALLVSGLSGFIYWIYKRFGIAFTLRDIVLFVLFLTVTGGLWFILQIMIGNFGIIADFIEYQIRLFKTQDAGHGGFLLYHFVVVFFGVFPSAVIAFAGFRRRQKLYFTGDDKDLQILMGILLAVVLILFTIVKTKILHYSSLAYFPLTFFAALVLHHFAETGKIFNRFSRVTIAILGTLYGVLVLILPFLIIFFKDRVLAMDIIADPFAAGNLQADVKWTGLEGVGGLLLIVGVILFLKYRRQAVKAAVIIYGATVLFISITLILVIPRVEGYTQRAAIEFYQSVAEENAYIKPLGFKSYAHLFYGEKQIPDNQLSNNTQWLLTGETDKTIYFVSKIQRKERYLKEYPQLEILYEKNGFVFYRRNKNIVSHDQ